MSKPRRTRSVPQGTCYEWMDGYKAIHGLFAFSYDIIVPIPTMTIYRAYFLTYNIFLYALERHEEVKEARRNPTGSRISSGTGKMLDSCIIFYYTQMLT